MPLPALNSQEMCVVTMFHKVSNLTIQKKKRSPKRYTGDRHIYEQQEVLQAPTNTRFSLPPRARSHSPKRGAALPQKKCGIPPKGMSRPPKRGGRPPQKGANQRSGQARAGRVTRGPGYCEYSRSSPGHRVRWTRQTSIVRRVDLTHVLLVPCQVI